MPMLLRDATVDALRSSVYNTKQKQQPFLSSFKKRPLPQQQLQNRFLSSNDYDESSETSSNQQQQKDQQHLVLVGGGHAHAQVIKALNWASRPSNLKVTLIDKQSSASYSGMVPGCISKLYHPDDTLLHLQPLADWAGMDFVHDRVVDIDFEKKLVHLQDNQNQAIPFDCISLDIGSTSRGLDDIPGARQNTIPTRPISKLVHRIEQSEQDMQAGHQEQQQQRQQQPKVVVIGGGAAGIELSLSLNGRWKSSQFPNTQVTLLDAGNELLPGESQIAKDALKQVLQDKGIDVKHGVNVLEVCEDHVQIDIQGNNPQTIPMTHCIWATGAGAHPLAQRLQDKGLAATKHSWIRVNEHLQSISHPFVFAAGDCCHIEHLEERGLSSPPKAGVFAVRAGPVLIENLTRYLKNLQSTENTNGNADSSLNHNLEKYTPQTDFLKLVVCGDGKALGFRFGQAFHGKWVMELKDTIDNNFMNLFKRENLPELKPGESYDTSQYDAKMAAKTNLNPEDAANLLSRTDDNVDYQMAWGVLRTMADDEDFREQVLSYMEEPALVDMHS